MVADIHARRKAPRQRAGIGVYGKQLTRRSRGRCELCEARKQVRLYELAPFPTEPEPDRLLMACGRCRRWLDTGDIEPMEAHFLSSAVWSQLGPVRLAAARLLLSCDHKDDPWLRDALDAADFDPSTGEFRI